MKRRHFLLGASLAPAVPAMLGAAAPAYAVDRAPLDGLLRRDVGDDGIVRWTTVAAHRAVDAASVQAWRVHLHGLVATKDSPLAGLDVQAVHADGEGGAHRHDVLRWRADAPEETSAGLVFHATRGVWCGFDISATRHGDVPGTCSTLACAPASTPDAGLEPGVYAWIVPTSMRAPIVVADSGDVRWPLANLDGTPLLRDYLVFSVTAAA
ncbi:hypothetical protein ACQQ2N_03715 [Dokdonella sp. MW10]|uniref:hypothetical protein n=1 Tax=Dokdonella sp. MW10 TaxID=2992926 RepID=UPI003F7D5EC2